MACECDDENGVKKGLKLEGGKCEESHNFYLNSTLEICGFGFVIVFFQVNLNFFCK